MGKYNIDSARKLFLEHGLILDETEYKNSFTKMNCHDDNGFKYQSTLDDIKSGRTPYKFFKTNPYSCYNIQHILDLETDGVILLDTEYIDSKTKMIFLCSCGKEFKMNTNSFVNGKRYCNYCTKSKRYDGLVDYQSIIQKKCDELGYTLLTTNIKRSTDTFDYICNKHKEEGVQHSYYDRMINMGQGCYYCGIISRNLKNRTPEEEIKKLAEEKGFIYVDREFRKYGKSTRMFIKCICKNHIDKGYQYISLTNLKRNKAGCIYCIGHGRTKESLQEEFDELNANLDILEFRKYSDITVKCRKCGKEWDTSGVNILSGHSCPSCCKSRYERKLEKYLQENNIAYKDQVRFEECRCELPLPFDFQLIDYNVLIEVDGQGHYMPVNFGGMSDEEAIKNFEIQKSRDEIKNDYCSNNNIELIRIPYTIFDSNELDSFLKTKLNIA